MQAILDFSQDLDVPTFDRVVQVMYTTAGADVSYSVQPVVVDAMNSADIHRLAPTATRGSAYLDAVPGTSRSVAARSCNPRDLDQFASKGDLSSSLHNYQGFKNNDS